MRFDVGVGEVIQQLRRQRRQHRAQGQELCIGEESGPSARLWRLQHPSLQSFLPLDRPTLELVCETVVAAETHLHEESSLAEDIVKRVPGVRQPLVKDHGVPHAWVQGHVTALPWRRTQHVGARNDLHGLLVVKMILKVEHHLVDLMLLADIITRPHIALLVLRHIAPQHILVPHTDEIATNVVVRGKPVGRAIERRLQKLMHALVLGKPCGAGKLWQIQEAWHTVATVTQG
mmetsp:Transcript_52889/g.104362  ORF Transcript_52889/g.104362 Transcript_52889/m.104362 type:complete len:232 (+) Transcript_52889:191-886(+)